MGGRDEDTTVVISLQSKSQTSSGQPPTAQPAPPHGPQSVIRTLFAKLLGGVLFAIPILLIIILLRQAIGLLARLLAPVAKLLPERTVAGVLVVDILAIALIVALCFALGMFVGTRWGRWTAAKLEHTVLRK